MKTRREKNPELNAVAAFVRKIDRIWATSSAQERAEQRCRALDIFEGTRHASYPLAWGVSTGRASAEFVYAMLALPARDFARIATEIASSRACVRDCWEAWKAAIPVTFAA